MERRSTTPGLPAARARRPRPRRRPRRPAGAGIRRLVLLALFAPALAPAVAPTPAWGQERGLEPRDLYRIPSVGSPEISPAGDLVAFTVTTVDEEKNTRNTAVWMQRLRDGRADGQPFRFTDPSRQSSSPRWSPDGTLLAISSRRGEDETSVRFLRVTAPGGEAFTLEGVTASPLWSRDGRWIALVEEPKDPDAEEDRRAGWIAPDAISRTEDAKRFDGRVVTHRRYKSDGTFSWLPHPAASKKRQLFLVPGEGGERRQLTEFPFNVRSPEWSPDGSRILFWADPAEDEDYSLDPTGHLFLVNVADGSVRQLTEGPGRYSSPTFAPDGRSIAFLHDPAFRAQTELLVAPLAADGRMEGSPRVLTEGWDRTPGSPFWTPDGRHVRFMAQDGGNTHLFEIPAGGGALRQVTSGERTIGSLSVSRDGRRMTYTSTDPVTPGEVWTARADGSGETRLTGFNDEWMAEVAVVPAERLSWTVADGTEVEGWVMRPVNHDPALRWPLVLNIHGGPYSAYRNAFSSNFQMLAASGFYVLYTNPRGSTGYGKAFQHAIDPAWGEVDEEDQIAAIDAALARHPDIDRNRLGVMGGSYGGYMTNWLTARTDRFAAAVSRASISSWESLAGTTDSSLPDAPFGGASYEERELYRRLSPISYVEGVTAPTLIIHGENDFRTPFGEGEQWYSALHKMGVPTEFVIYPRSSHGIREPWLQVDAAERTRSWLRHWLIEQPTPRPVSVR